MWYTVPDSRPIPEEPPKPIFPWERQQRKRPQATRIFSEDHPPSPQLDQPWSPPGTTWEENSGGMEKYIKDIMSSMSDKPKGNGVTSPLTGRRESLVFTGIPMPQDRPSLPVTPAPLVHNPFWGNEQNKTEDGKGSHNEILLNQAEWVCPHCGFSSNNPAVFASLPSSSSAHPLPPASPETPKTPEPEPKNEPRTLDDEDSSRPNTLQRASSSEMSAISSSSTMVPLETKAADLPSPPFEPAPPKDPLPPPAWLTAVISEEEETLIPQAEPEKPNPIPVSASANEVTVS